MPVAGARLHVAPAVGEEAGPAVAVEDIGVLGAPGPAEHTGHGHRDTQETPQQHRTETPPADGPVLYIISTINLQVSSATMADMVRVAVNIGDVR